MIQDPQQGPLFPSAIRLHKIVPDANQYRYYRLSTQSTLFGNWALMRKWGRRWRQPKDKTDSTFAWSYFTRPGHFASTNEANQDQFLLRI